MERLNFSDVFQENTDGSLTPKRQIQVGGVTFSPGASFQKGVTFGGVDFHLYKHLSIAAEEENGILIFKGFYQQ